MKQANGMSDDEQLLAALAGVLEPLWRLHLARPDQACSLAKLSKQSQRPMSILMRHLTILGDAGWASVAPREEGGGAVALTPAGLQLCASLFAER